MIVHCPHCSTSYVLPDALLGPAGARVRCPRCRGAFAVGAEGRPAGETPAGDAAASAALDALSARAGTALAEAHARGTLYVEWGSALADAFDDYLRAAGAAADPAAFRREVRARWGIELVPAERSVGDPTG